jgi:hypothetical protein
VTVRELIERLKMFPSDSRILVQGYEGGYDDITHLTTVAVLKNNNAHFWDGEYEELRVYFGTDIHGAAENVLVIFGNRRDTKPGRRMN